MRLATWNCQSGLDANWDELEKLDANVLTVQECGSSTKEQADARGWSCEWKEGKYHKGLAVLAKSPYEIDDVEDSEPFAVSVIISGPTRFRFVGFWAMSPKAVGYTYTRQATRLIERLPDDGFPTVVAGDFDASKSRSHLANVERLGDLDLVSAYHLHHAVEHSGEEEHLTLYFLWNETRKFHMDFVFVPRAWRIKRVDVGTFEDYTRRRVSDHVPVVVTIEPEPTSQLI